MAFMACIFVPIYLESVYLIEVNRPSEMHSVDDWKYSDVLYARRWVMRQTRTLLSGIPEICEISVERHVYNVSHQPARRVFTSWFKRDLLGKILLSERCKMYTSSLKLTDNFTRYIGFFTNTVDAYKILFLLHSSDMIYVYFFVNMIMKF